MVVKTSPWPILRDRESTSSSFLVQFVLPDLGQFLFVCFYLHELMDASQWTNLGGHTSHQSRFSVCHLHPRGRVRWGFLPMVTSCMCLFKNCYLSFLSKYYVLILAVLKKIQKFQEEKPPITITLNSWYLGSVSFYDRTVSENLHTALSSYFRFIYL